MIKIINENANTDSSKIAELLIYLADNDYTESDILQVLKLYKRLPSIYSKISKDLEEYKGPNNPKLPDGHNSYEQFITNDPEEMIGYTIFIAGDIDDPRSNSVFVGISTDETQYSKEFNFFTEFDKAIELANTLSDNITVGMSSEEIEKFANGYSLYRD